MTEKESMLRKLGAVRFAMLELHLYLDSHPGDCDAAAKMEEYRKSAKELTAQYEAAFGPLNQSPTDTGRWAWITEPWPWEV